MQEIEIEIESEEDITQVMDQGHVSVDKINHEFVQEDKLKGQIPIGFLVLNAGVDRDHGAGALTQRIPRRALHLEVQRQDEIVPVNRRRAFQHLQGAARRIRLHLLDAAGAMQGVFVITLHAVLADVRAQQVFQAAGRQLVGSDPVKSDRTGRIPRGTHRRHPSEVVEIGEEISVKVLKFDREKMRVSLGLKQMGEDPWINLSRRYPENTRIFGKVTNLADYGCFVEIEEGVEIEDWEKASRKQFSETVS